MSVNFYRISSLLSYGLAPLILLTTACAEPNQDQLSKPQIHHYNENKNFTGAYLAARSARIYYDFKAAQKNAENSFVLSSMENSYLADQAVRLSLIQNNFDAAQTLASQHIGKINLKKEDTKNSIGTFSIITLLIDHLKNERPNQALEIFEDLKLSLNKPMRALIGGTIYRANGNFKKAELIEANLNGFALFDMLRIFHAANSAYIEKDTKKALSLFKKSSKYLDPLAVRSILSAVQIHIEKGEKDKAITLLKQHSKNQPDDLLWAANTRLTEGKDINFPLSKTYLQILGEDLYNIGILYARQNDYESAIAFLRAAQISGVSHAYLLSALAETYSIIKDYEQSSTIYLSIAKNDKLLIGRESLIGAAFTLNASKHDKEAQKLLKQAMKNDPKYYRYPYILADILRGSEDYKEAIPYFTKALKLGVDISDNIKWQLLYGRGISYEQTDQWEKAELDFIKALTLAPNNPDLINYLAYSWVDRGTNLDKALLMLQNAVKNRPKSGYIVDSFGWAYFRTGKYEQAVPVLENAVSLMPYDSVVNDHLGDAYWKIGRKREANFQWQHALDFNPKDKDKKRILAKIAVGYDLADSYKAPSKKTASLTKPQTSSKTFLNLIKSFINRVSGAQ